MSNKLEILNLYKKICKEWGKKLTRDEFCKNSDISKHKINQIYGSFSNLRKDYETDVFESDINFDHQEFAGIKNNSTKATFNGDDGELSSCSKEIKTLNDLIEECEIDLDKWTITKHIINKWGNVDNLNFQVKAWLERKGHFSLDDIMEMFKEQSEKYSPQPRTIPTFKKDSGSMYLLGIFDHHIGKLVWGEETGYGNYNVDIAIERYKEAADYLISRISNDDVDTLVIPIGNDLLNSDTIDNTTTAGTPQHEDDRWIKVYRKTCQMLIDIIESYSDKYKIKIIQIAGNHDKSRGYFVADYLKAWFRNYPTISVDNSPSQRKYLRFGTNLIGFTHGNNEKMADLPMIMANEAKEHWATTKNRIFLLGHFHQQSSKEFNGVRVEILPSLAEPCEWHSSKGYVGNLLCSKSFLFDKEKGMLANFFFNLD
jgi:predicted phosphodiesterase